MSELKDITGQRFARLTAIRPVRENGKPLKWECRCDCGNTIFAVGAALRNGHTKSCGCYRTDMVKKNSEKDLTGMQFGRLQVVEKAYSKHNRTYWVCLCECGNYTVASTRSLTSGNVKSCKCLRNSVDGESHDNLYRRWVGMRMRCKENASCHEHYYDKGIAVCDEWLGENGYRNFREWAMGNGYRQELTIDRIDNNKGYSPENCRWVTMYIQNNNRDDNKYVIIGGVKKTLSQWCLEFGLNYSAIKGKVSRGIDPSIALGVADAVAV